MGCASEIEHANDIPEGRSERKKKHFPALSREKKKGVGGGWGGKRQIRSLSKKHQQK